MEREGIWRQKACSGGCDRPPCWGAGDGWSCLHIYFYIITDNSKHSKAEKPV